MKNTKTTLAGVGAILVAVGGALRAAFDADPSTNIDIAVKAGGVANARAALPLVDLIVAAAQPKSE